MVQTAVADALAEATGIPGVGADRRAAARALAAAAERRQQGEGLGSDPEPGPEPEPEPKPKPEPEPEPEPKPDPKPEPEPEPEPVPDLTGPARSRLVALAEQASLDEELLDGMLSAYNHDAGAVAALLRTQLAARGDPAGVRHFLDVGGLPAMPPPTPPPQVAVGGEVMFTQPCVFFIEDH
jgi:hypothetical protein